MFSLPICAKRVNVNIVKNVQIQAMCSQAFDRLRTLNVITLYFHAAIVLFIRITLLTSGWINRRLDGLFCPDLNARIPLCRMNALIHLLFHLGQLNGSLVLSPEGTTALLHETILDRNRDHFFNINMFGHPAISSCSLSRTT